MLWTAAIEYEEESEVEFEEESEGEFEEERNSSYGEKQSERVRLFVVVQQKKGHCICL